MAQVDAASFDSLDLAGADVREPNITGQLGDAAFGQLLATQQTPLTLAQSLWRLSVLPLAFTPFGLAYAAIAVPAIAAAASAVGSYGPPAAAAVLAVLGVGLLLAVARKIKMVKQGTVCFVQYFENGTTHVLQAGLQLVASFGTTMQEFPVTTDRMCFGTISFVRVRPGFLGRGTQNGQPVLLLAGQHLINEPNFELLDFKSINDKTISNGPINLVRVPPSELGLAMVNKKPLVLDCGLHFVNDPSFEFCGSRSINDNLIQLGPVAIVRVEPGMLGLATINGQPLLLDVGVHFLDEPSFRMHPDGWRRVDEQLITIGPINVLTVPRGKVVPVLVNGEGHFLLEGRHFINQPRFQCLKGGPLTQEYLSAGTRHRIVVPRGKLGLALEQGEPVLYEPGSVHLVNSPLFQYSGSVDVTQQVVAHGSLKIVTIKDGQVGITYKNGALQLLPTGRHTIADATHVLAGFVSTGQQTLRISEVTGMSLDNVELTFDAAICIRVVDAQKAVIMLTSGASNIVETLHANIQERAKLDLSTIIGKNRLNKKHEATAASKEAAPAAEDDFEHVAEAGGGGFRSAIHDNFMQLFKQEMLNECGIEVINMAIEDVRIVDHELAKALASAAVANSSLERQTIEAEIVQVKAAAEAKVAEIDAEGKARAMKILAAADAERIGTVSAALAQACAPVQQQETIRASGGALSAASTVLLAQDIGALANLLGGPKGAELSPPLRR